MAEKKDRLRAAKIRHLFANQNIGSVANLVNACILVIILWPVVNRSVLLEWMAADWGITLGRTLLWRIFVIRKPDQASIGLWGNIFLAGTFLSGLIWGVAGVALFPAHSVVHQMFTAFTIGGMVAGASAAYSAMFRAFFAFSLPAMLPTIFNTFSFMDGVHTAMGAMMVLFLILMIGTCYRNHRIHEDSMTLRFENKGLIAYLTEAKALTEEVNHQLKAENAERLKIERQLEIHQKELESIVEKRTRELENRNHQLDLEVRERQRAQTALAESEERYRLLVESANVGIALLCNTKVLFANRFATAITGYSAEEVQDISFLDLVHPDDRQMATDYHVNRLRGEPVPESYQIRLLNKVGEVRYLEVSAVLMSYGQEPSVLIFFRDISQYRHLEAQLLQSEKMASIGQLAAGVAHEINNPVGFVNSNLQTLREYLVDFKMFFDLYQCACKDMQPGIEAEAITAKIESMRQLEKQIDLEFLLGDCPQLIKESLEGTQRIKNIVNDLKNFAHPGEEGHRPADINQCIESTLNIVWNEVKYHATVTKELGLLPEIVVNAQQINQVFMNLLVNAAQSIQEEGEIKILTRAENNHVEVRISDTGCGIPAAALNKIFDPFFTTKPVGSGTGLGLNVSYNIIQKHNGTISVESQVGQGTTFIVRLPIKSSVKSI